MPDLLAALDAFLQEHRRCGDLEGGRSSLDGVRLRGCCVALGTAGRLWRRTDGTERVRRLPAITLMQADEVARPFHRDGWICEEKYDGWRMVVYKDSTAVRLVSRAGKELSRRFLS